MALDELRGTELGTQSITIEAGPVRAFALSLGDDPARYRDEAGESLGTPPTWPFVMPYWSDLGEGGAAGFPMDRLRGPGRMILHGEQEFEFVRSPRVGETLVGDGRISDVSEKATSSATMEFYVREITWRDAAGDVVVVDRFTMIVRVPDVTDERRRLAPTWDHPARHPFPVLEHQPSIEDLFEEVGTRPDVGGKVVLVDGDVRLTGLELLDRVRHLAGGLAARGVRRGDAVCFQTPSWWETTCLYRACWRLGAVAVPIHHLSAEADVAGAVASVDPVLVVSDAARPLATHPGAIEVRGDGGFEALLGESGPVVEVRAEPTDLAVVLFTSGSTGGPKGVLHTHRALAYKARTLLDIHGIDDRDTVLMPAPMAHISGLSNAVMLPGAGGLTSILMAKWDPAEAVRLIERELVTFMMGPPTFFQTMMATPDFTDDAVATMRLISCGGAGVTPAFVEVASVAFGAVVKRTYGSTEAPVVTTWHAGDEPDRTGDSDGRAAGVIDLRIDSPDDQGAGELWLRGPELFVGYTDPSRNDASIGRDPEGGEWFRTGDLATLETGDDGHEWLRIVGRIKDIIIRGGENISAAELEGVLESHPAVHQAVAVGFPDDRLGERVCAFVVCHAPGEADAPFDLVECRRWFETAGVTKFKWPERIEHLDHVPVLASSGKADRAELRRMAAGLSQGSHES